MLFLKKGNYIKEHTPDAENAGSLSFGLFPSEMKPILPRCLNSRFSVSVVADVATSEWISYPPIGKEFPRPACLPEMLEVAKALSAPFPYVRVDLYEQNNRPIFGEMTFYPASGYSDFKPPEWDAKLGELIVLPGGRSEK